MRGWLADRQLDLSWPVAGVPETLLDFLSGQRRLIRRDGIRLFHIHYWANELSPLAGRTKELLLIAPIRITC
jgi:hypothetical protein